jgi:chromosome segregation ATPase
MILKLNEEKELAHAYSKHLEARLEGVNSLQRKLEIQKIAVEVRLEDAQQTIEELHENIQLTQLELIEAQKKSEQLQADKHTIDLELTKTNGRLEEANRNSFIQFIVSVIASVSLALGVNILTATPNDWKGGTLVIIGIVLGAIAFFIARKSK